MTPETDCPDAGPPTETRRNVLKGSVAGIAAGLLAIDAFFANIRSGAH